ncbi:MAG: IS66 family insertion sequence element accessory protein TnpB [Ruminococcus sp.]|jgi:transposase
MIDFSGSTTVYLACGVTDLRKSYTGLAAIIKLKFHLDPYSCCMFAFCNRRRTLIKILQWDGSGFRILMKRLNRDSFHWPDTPDELQKVSLKEIHWLHYKKQVSIRELFEEDRKALLLLPPKRFDVCRYEWLKADGYGKSSYLRVCSRIGA